RSLSMPFKVPTSPPVRVISAFSYITTPRRVWRSCVRRGPPWPGARSGRTRWPHTRRCTSVHREQCSATCRGRRGSWCGSRGRSFPSLLLFGGRRCHASFDRGQLDPRAGDLLGLFRLQVGLPADAVLLVSVPGLLLPLVDLLGGLGQVVDAAHLVSSVVFCRAA